MNDNYSPYTAALAAAATELTSARARRYYSIRAQQDFQTAISGAVALGCWVYQIAALVFELGKAARQCIDLVNVAASTATSQQPVQRRSPLVLLPAAAPIALLPACVEPKAIAQQPPSSPLPAPSMPAQDLSKLPAHSLSKAELIIQIQQRSQRKVPGVWKMRRAALEQIYAGV